jgi:membrane-associated phospholipid phosphatase
MLREGRWRAVAVVTRDDAHALRLTLLSAHVRPDLPLWVTMFDHTVSRELEHVAFAGGAGDVLPAVSLPLHALASLVAYSRVHTGVHYPLDALVGSLLGVALDDVTRGLGRG